MWIADLDDVISAQQLAESVDAIESCQLDSGMIPWFPGGHADPWNHTHAAMALVIGGRRAAADRAFEWLADRQRPDGAWHRYELADRVEEDKLDANVCAYPATGLWYHWRCFQDRSFVSRMWPMIDAAMEFVLDLQLPAGEIQWARHSDGTPWPYALLTGSSSITLSLRCALALADEMGHERPRWSDSVTRLTRRIRDHVDGAAPEAFAPKHRWAMDWYYPVLVGALAPDDAIARLASDWDRFSLEDRGIRCVADQPWVTAAETCECAMSYLRVGERERALALLSAAHRLRADGGHYWTGYVVPDAVNFPADERSTYTGAAIIVTADAISGASPASALWVDPDAVPNAGYQLAEA